MAEPFIFTNTTAIKEGQLEAWVKSFAEFAEDIERAEPRLLHFAMYVSEDGTEETLVQVHPDADSMLFHMGLLAEHGHATGDYLDFSRSTTRIYGNPTPELLEKIRAFSPDIDVLVSTPQGGFSRVPAR
jgi:quinol monooxygenase YgiN